MQALLYSPRNQQCREGPPQASQHMFSVQGQRSCACKQPKPTANQLISKLGHSSIISWAWSLCFTANSTSLDKAPLKSSKRFQSQNPECFACKDTPSNYSPARSTKNNDFHRHKPGCCAFLSFINGPGLPSAEAKPCAHHLKRAWSLVRWRSNGELVIPVRPVPAITVFFAFASTSGRLKCECRKI